MHPTVVHMLAAATAARPQAQALVFGDRSLTYAEYAGAAAALAGELGALGVAGGRVATLLPNSIEACVAAFGVPAAGAQHVPLNPLYTSRELEEILRDADPAVLIADERLPAPAGPWKTIHPKAEPRHAVKLALPDPDALALLQYTGGTTGRAKGVNLTHRAIATNVWQRENLLPTALDRERILCVMPLFHSYAMAMGLFLAVNCRGCLVLLERYSPEQLLAAISRERITIFPGSPTIFVGLMGHPDLPRTDWSSVHTCYSGASALAEETLKRWREAVGAPVYEGYGQTEAGPVLAFNAEGMTRPGSVGVPLAQTEIQIVDVATGGKVLPACERGEIRARGPQLMQGYRNRTDETAQALRGGWLYTGDIGELDADGYLYIRDRKKDMVIVGGYNVYPREVEEVLCSHPAVAEAAVVGAPDPYYGERVHAYVALRPDVNAARDVLFEHCRERLARYKVPSVIEILDALPKTSVNKLDKLALKHRSKGALQ